MLQIENVYLSYDQPVLQGVSFDVQQGEIVGIAGHSGGGKTSLLKIIGGLADATSGHIYLDGKEVVGPKMRLIPGHADIQLVNQDFSLDLYQTTEENIKGKILHLTKELQQEFIEELLELLELSKVRNHHARLLSGGEQQRLAIARALAREPQILLLDEPFVHLDVQLRFKLVNYLLELRKLRNMSLIIVSHNSEELLSLTDRIVLLSNGVVERIATPREFYYNYQNEEQAEMFGIVNKLEINGEFAYFRPDEYEIDESQAASVPLTFTKAIFMGSFYLNQFLAPSGQQVVLLHKETLDYVTGIKIRSKR